MKQMFAAALALAFASLSLAQDRTRYVALVNGGKDRAGHLVTTRSGDRFKADFFFKDNGRGPELKEEYTLAGDGTWVYEESNGLPGLQIGGPDESAEWKACKNPDTLVF